MAKAIPTQNNKLKFFLLQVDFTILTDNRVKINEKINKYWDFFGELKKAVELEGDIITIVVGALWMVAKGLEKWLENQRDSWDHLDHGVVETG